MGNETKVNVTVTEPAQVVTILHGKALDPQEPRVVNIVGNIDAPKRYLQIRSDNGKNFRSHILVSQDDLSITLIVDETDPFGAVIAGQLKFSKEFRLFEINTGKRFTTFDLAALIRMNRTYFESQDYAKKLVNDLQNFKAKVDKELEASDDKRGNITMKKIQAVSSNIPDSFKLNIPVFKGLPIETIEVEIDIDPNSLECSIVSPEANDIVERIRNNAINQEIDEIRKIAPEIVIMYV